MARYVDGITPQSPVEITTEYLDRGFNPGQGKSAMTQFASNELHFRPKLAT
jgi:hypothetical protein